MKKFLKKQWIKAILWILREIYGFFLHCCTYTQNEIKYSTMSNKKKKWWYPTNLLYILCSSIIYSDGISSFPERWMLQKNAKFLVALRGDETTKKKRSWKWSFIHTWGVLQVQYFPYLTSNLTFWFFYCWVYWKLEKFLFF